MRSFVASLFSRWKESYRNADVAGRVVQLIATAFVILLIPCCLCSIPVMLVDTEDTPEPTKVAIVPETDEDTESDDSEIATSVSETVDALAADASEVADSPVSLDTPVSNTSTPTSTATKKPTSTSTATSEPTETLTPPYPEGDLVEVVNVVDGDTIEVEMDGAIYPVRYIGMDTPERGDTYYKEATEANAELVEGETVILVKDVSETDRYNRLLRYVYCLDGTFVNAELVRLGFAQPATYPPDVLHKDDFLELQQEARETSSGLWGLPTETPIPLPTDTPLPQPSNTPIPLPTDTPVSLPTNTPVPLPTNTPIPLPTNTPLPPPTWTPAPPPTAVPQPTLPPPPPPTEPTAQNCHPSYQGVCLLMGIGDYDCAGGSGNGPNYAQGPFQVVGPDEFDLDRDNDGIGCE